MTHDRTGTAFSLCASIGWAETISAMTQPTPTRTTPDGVMAERADPDCPRSLAALLAQLPAGAAAVALRTYRPLFDDR